MAQKWYSNGKLMLTGEYLVLFGAKALAMPLKLGQSLEVREEEGGPSLTFSTEVLGKPWFTAKFTTDFFEIINANNVSSACYLQELFLAARLLNPLFLRQKKKINVYTKVNFDIEWGLGSSSTLISNISWWAGVDPFELNRMVSMGSGYDIACARHKFALLYSIIQDNPVIEPIKFKPTCSDHIWFVYLGNKVATEVNLMKIIKNIKPTSADIEHVTTISDAMSNAQTVSEFSSLLSDHESVISKILKKPGIQSIYFNDFKGSIKSLGAWGGDFCMVVSGEDSSYVKNYFEHKRLRTVLTFNDLAL